MQRSIPRLGMAGSIAAIAVASVLCTSLVANADTLQDTIEDTAASALVLVAGGSGSATAGIRVVGNNAAGDPDPGCNIDAGEAPLVLDIVTPTGITATPSPLSLTTCGDNATVTFTAGANAVDGTVTVVVKSGPAGGGSYQNQVSIGIDVVNPNTKPSVAVQGVTAGDYEIGSVPTPSCAITDTEDGNGTSAATVTGQLTNGLGTLTATCDYTDEGGLKADTATVSYRVLDTGLPTITHTLDAEPNAAGWFRSSVGIDYTCTDGGSGIASCGPDTTLGEGENQTDTGTAVDHAGNTAEEVVSNLDIDLSAPGVTADLTPAEPNANGWYAESVDVDFSCTDNLSGVATCTGDTTIGEGATGAATGEATDVAGNVGSKTVSGVKVDVTAPTLGYSLRSDSTPSSGWYNAPVTVDFTCADTLSGIDACLGDVTLGEGADQSAKGTATDAAGNSVSRTVTDIDVDLTEPGITAALTPGDGPNGNGWYKQSVGVDFSCTDALSGVATCTGDTTIGEGATGSATGEATDVATNTASRTVSGIKVDVTAPTVGYSLTSTSTPVNGWYNAPVTVDFTCGDALSGVDACTGDTTLGEAENQSATGTATDAAGNVTSRTVEDIDIDTTAPTVGFAAGFGTSHAYGAVPAAPACVGSDALSGLASCEVTGRGTGLGTHTLVATAKDKAGNVTTATLSYDVLPWTLTGFTSPVDMGGTWNTVKGGSTVPLKFEVFQGTTELTSLSSITSFTAVAAACPGASAKTDEIELTTTGGTALRYDATGGQFIQNWQTPKKPGTCAKVTMTTQDGSALTANFILK